MLQSQRLLNLQRLQTWPSAESRHQRKPPSTPAHGPQLIFLCARQQRNHTCNSCRLHSQMQIFTECNNNAGWMWAFGPASWGTKNKHTSFKNNSKLRVNRINKDSINARDHFSHMSRFMNLFIKVLLPLCSPRGAADPHVSAGPTWLYHWLIFHR